MNQMMIVSRPIAAEEQERAELLELNARIRDNVERHRQYAVEAELIASQQARRQARRAAAQQRVRIRCYAVGGLAGILAVLAFGVTGDLGLTAIPVLGGAWLLGRR
ncbi:MAG: hypothetical protein J6K89_06330 [Oscillospiraceae bacterium]|nr:hypothetical protein [Oscillospiraceae bacterium]